MKVEDTPNRRAHEAKLDELSARLTAIKQTLFEETKDWVQVFSSSVYLDAEHLWAEHRNSCPECGHPEVEVINYDYMWRDGDVVCKRCKAYVRGYDAG